MKKYLLLFIMIVMVIPMFGQSTVQDKRILVDPSDLPPSVLQELRQKNEVQEIEQKIQTYGKWAGMGKEVGVAFREGLTAVKDVSIEFAESDLGFFTMVMIAWNVVGEDVSRILIGGFIALFMLILISVSYFKTCIPKKIYKNGRQPLLLRLFKSSGEYTVSRPLFEDGGGALLHLLGLLASVGISFAIAFA